MASNDHAGSSPACGTRWPNGGMVDALASKANVERRVGSTPT